jgi:hypothetical protein
VESAGNPVYIDDGELIKAAPHGPISERLVHEIGGWRGPSTVAKRLARHFTFGRSRVLTPVPGVGFFQRFPHIITSWYVSYHR